MNTLHIKQTVLMFVRIDNIRNALYCNIYQWAIDLRSLLFLFHKTVASASLHYQLVNF